MNVPRPAAVRFCATLAVLTCLAVAPASAAAKPGPAGQLLVKPRAGAGGAALDRALSRVGAKRIGVVPELGVEVVEVGASRRKAALDSLRAADAVAYAEPNGLTPPAEVIPNDVWWTSEWSQIQTRTDKAWDATAGAAAVKLAVLDSGVDPSQPDLAAKLLPGRDFYNNDYDASDDNGHGTAVAGVGAGRSDNGVGIAGYCGGCSILPVKIAGADGYATWSAMASGVVWATDQGARVINLSFAGSSGSATVAEAIAYAHGHGAVVTVAAGNSSSSSKTYPAAYPGALAIAAVDGGDGLASYSNYGPWVQLAAPGCNYATKRTSTTPLFSSFCGTSSAAPAAAGIAALAFSYDPSADNVAVEGALEASAAPDGFTQYGRIDAWGALARLGAANPAPTAPLNGGAPTIVAGNGGPLVSAPQPGQSLAASGGRWSGAPSTAISYQWQRCDSAGVSCGPISGATSQTYTPASADSGYTLRAAVTATNSLGSASAVSPPSTVVGGSSAETSTEPSPTPTPATTTSTTTFSGSISAKQPSKSFSLAVGAGDSAATLTFSKAASLTLTLLAPDGTTVAGVSGASGLQLTRALAAGTYRYVVSGTVRKGSASFSLSVTYATP